VRDIADKLSHMFSSSLTSFVQLTSISVTRTERIYREGKKKESLFYNSRTSQRLSLYVFGVDEMEDSARYPPSALSVKWSNVNVSVVNERIFILVMRLLLLFPSSLVVVREYRKWCDSSSSGLTESGPTEECPLKDGFVMLGQVFFPESILKRSI
jgi:hypothetical protein